MNAQNMQHIIPQWFQKELEKTPDPDETSLSQYDYLKEDLLDALDQAAEHLKTAQPSPLETTADAVFSKIGQLKRWSEEMLREWLSPQDAPEEAYAGVRSVDHQAGKQEVCLVKVSKVCGETRIQAATYQNREQTEIEINVVKDLDDIEIRPFSVTVYDDQGDIIQETLRIGQTQVAPRFPDPRPGLYVFSLSWDIGHGQLRLEFE